MVPVFAFSKMDLTRMVSSMPLGEGAASALGIGAGSGGGSSEDSPSAEGTPDPQHPRKRTRASKPKVRTGCITWIRRVKCGEEKPACFRCTSTGRTCDGYDSQSTAAKKRLQVQNRPRPLPAWKSAPSSAAGAAGGGGGGLRVLRPLVSNIEGTDVERMYFHAFRRIAEEGVSQHVSNATDFWRTAVPQMCLAESPVKHSFVALGAALQSYQNREREERDKGQSSTLTETEVFMLDHYSRALSMLYQRADSEIPDRINVTLLCCLAFVYIESLRDNWLPALTHLANGLRIVATLSDETLAPLTDLKKKVTTPGREASPLSTELDYMLRLFATLEISACLFAEDFTPVISLRLYEMRKLDDTPMPSFESVDEVHGAIVQFCRDLFALVYTTRAHRQDPKFWETGTMGRQREIQFLRMGQVRERLLQYTNSTFMPEPRTQDYCSILLDLLHFQCCELVCETLRQPSNLPHATMPSTTPISPRSVPTTPLAPTTTPNLTPPPPPPPPLDTTSNYIPAIQTTLQRVDDILRIAEILKVQLIEVSSPAQKDRWFMLDVGIIPPMHFILSNCEDPVLRGRALAVMKGWPRRENLWDGDGVGRLVRRSDRVSVQVSRGLFSGAVPSLYEKLADLKLADED